MGEGLDRMAKKGEYRKRFMRWRGCDLKEPYATRELADAVVSAMAYREKRSSTELSVYECQWCHCWHVGHDNG